MTKSAPRAGGGRGRGYGLVGRRKCCPGQCLRNTTAGGCKILTAQKALVLRGFCWCIETKRPGRGEPPPGLARRSSLGDQVPTSCSNNAHLAGRVCWWRWRLVSGKSI